MYLPLAAFSGFRAFVAGFADQRRLRGHLALPFGLAHTGARVHRAGEDEEQVGKAIDVAEQRRAGPWLQGHDTALGAAADGAGDVKR